MKDWLPRLCEAMVVDVMKGKIIDSSSIFQVGGQPGHGPEEHIYSIKSLLSFLEQAGEGMVFTLVDIIAFFDKENILDVMDMLHEVGVNKKAARLFFKLNEGTEVAVKTAGGISETASVGDCIGQGTSGGAIVSGANLDQGLEQYFGKSSDEMFYGCVKLQPVAYQDDVGHANKDVHHAQVGNIKLACMLQDKGLQAHKDKTCFIVFGSKEYKRKAQQDLESNPLMFGDFTLKQRASEKYLGQVFHTDGLSRSSEATVEERSGRIRGASIEVKAIIEEFEMQAMGGLMAAWELWEKALVPSLLSGAGTWIGEASRAVNLCDNIQNFFWRVVLRVPESCPKLALRCETGMIGMKWRVWLEKVALLVRIQNKKANTLCKRIYEEGKVKGWPGLSQEVSDICAEIGIPDVNHNVVENRRIKEAIFMHHYKDMKKALEHSSKLESIKHEDFRKPQSYMHDICIENGRMAFRIRSKMVDSIPENFKNKYKKDPQGLICSYCSSGEIFSQSHCLECPAWQDIREGLDMKDMKDLTMFFRKLLSERSKLEGKKA